MTLELATGPVSWGVDFADAPTNPPYAEVLEGALAAGFRRLELGPLGYLPDDLDPADLGLAIPAGFIFEPLHEALQLPRIERVASATAERLAAVGAQCLVIVPAVTGERAQSAGDEGHAPRLGTRGRSALQHAVDRVASVARSHGLDPVLHPHAGTYVEFADEIEPLLELADLCLDTGHLAYAGIDPAAACRSWGARVHHVHLKDLSPARVRGDFWASVRAGAFVPLGRGSVDLAAILQALAAIGYEGSAVVEQDRAAATGDPVVDLRASRAHLESLMRA